MDEKDENGLLPCPFGCLAVAEIGESVNHFYVACPECGCNRIAGDQAKTRQDAIQQWNTRPQAVCNECGEKMANLQ